MQSTAKSPCPVGIRISATQRHAKGPCVALVDFQPPPDSDALILLDFDPRVNT